MGCRPTVVKGRTQYVCPGLNCLQIPYKES
jgi:hypothetical protein